MLSKTFSILLVFSILLTFTDSSYARRKPEFDPDPDGKHLFSYRPIAHKNGIGGNLGISGTGLSFKRIIDENFSIVFNGGLSTAGIGNCDGADKDYYAACLKGMYKGSYKTVVVPYAYAGVMWLREEVTYNYPDQWKNKTTDIVGINGGGGIEFQFKYFTIDYDLGLMLGPKLWDFKEVGGAIDMNLAIHLFLF